MTSRRGSLAPADPSREHLLGLFKLIKLTKTPSVPKLASSIYAAITLSKYDLILLLNVLDTRYIFEYVTYIVDNFNNNVVNVVMHVNLALRPHK